MTSQNFREIIEGVKDYGLKVAMKRRGKICWLDATW